MEKELSPAAGNSFLIEQANWRDLNPLRHIEQVCFPKDAWPLWDLIGVLTLPNVVRLKAMVDGQMAGFIAGDIRTSQHMAWIATVGVLPEYRGRGIGEALMRACEGSLTVPTVRLNVRISNQPAIRLYLNLGYQKVGVWPGYYQDGEEALVMEKRLS
ncbi:MAG TPA: GNAT family N-acetyltransferase [Anaerolineales bacterium]